jgi:uncharacterized protein (DUF2336 family)
MVADFTGLQRFPANPVREPQAPEWWRLVTAQRSLIAEVENAISAGSSEKRVETLRRVTDLFLLNADQCAADQVEVFDDVFCRLAERIETRARAELAGRLASVDNAPIGLARSLANDTAIEVAGPMLSQSNRLSEEDLLACANNGGQDRLLAISKRGSISEAVSDALVTRGNSAVVRSVAQNGGARFSSRGFGKLVERSIEDEALALCVGMRKDIPKDHLQSLIMRASEAVSRKLVAGNPAAAAEVDRVLHGMTGNPREAKRPARDYKYAESLLASIKTSAAPIEPIVQQFAKAGRFEETVMALADTCRLPLAAVDHIMTDQRPENQLPIVLCKAAGFSWPTTKCVLQLQRAETSVPPGAWEAALADFNLLQTTTAQRIVRFYQIRHSAAERDQ